MSAHQVITGALNKGENVFSTGSVDGINFTACAVGTDVVILSSSFDRVQVIPEASAEDEQIVTCVNCCSESGKIAAAYGKLIRIFEPVYQPTVEQNNHKLDYRWCETHSVTMDLPVGSVLWNLEGYRLLICCGDRLLLYQHRDLTIVFAETAKLQSKSPVMFTINEEDQEPQVPDSFSPMWESIWAINLSSSPKFIQYSPDGCFLATCGEYDRMIKIWFQESDFNENIKAIRFDFIYLQHPAPVSGFEWRKISRYMPRRCVQNVLVSWCEDNTARLWKEAPFPDDCLSFNSDLTDSGCYDEINVEKFYQHRQRFTNARRKVMTRLKNLMKAQQKKTEDLSQNSIKSFSTAGGALIESGLAVEANKFVQFHLSASVNAENEFILDCFLVPSLENSSVKRKSFSVHWLNNKELMYGIGAERIIAELMLNKPSVSATSINVNDKGDDTGVGNEDTVSISDLAANSNYGNAMPNEQSISSCLSFFISSTESLSTRDTVDVKLETLIREWCKTSDVLFAVHPVDGSLLTWTVEWLDDACRQPTISFTSRFPSAFPLTDAASLNPSLYTFNSDIPVYFNVLNLLNTQASSKKRCMEHEWDDHITNVLYLLTSHENGSLNLWHLSMEESSKFTTILNVSHVSRMCGHRFQVSHVSPHPSLPLMLTSSQFKEGRADGLGRAELILWKVNPVGLLCKSGGVRELARVAGTSSKTFFWMAWIPAVLPSCTLGSICDSPSSCFIASDGKKLSVYQAVVDAASFLAEMYSSNKKNANTSFDSSADEYSSTDDNEQQSSVKNMKDLFNVISTQSTAKPGCVLYLSSLENSEHEADNVLFLHVFNQRLALVNNGQVGTSGVTSASDVERSRHSYFSDCYFVVLIERVNNIDRVRMWSLSIKSRASLELHSEEMCNHPLSLPDGVTITSAVATAGHLSSSNLYPACKAPYVILTSCSDDRVRFWNCVRMQKPNGQISYSWQKWHMIGDLMDSDLELEGQIFAVSAAHSGRFACAYMPEGAVASRLSCLKSVKIGVFECESSGGVEWLREDTLVIDKKPLYTKRSLEVLSNTFIGKEFDSSCEKIKKLESSIALGDEGNCIRIDWVSTEDGSHLLTVALGSSIYLFTQVSQGIAQRNIVMMKEHETHKRPPLRKASSLANPEGLSARLVHWLCIRYLELQSADGRAPLPTTVNWVRDGILIVGMHSEMRCYNQWNFFTPNVVKRSSVEDRPKELTLRKRGTASHLGVGLNISPSHSMLDQLSKKTRCEIGATNKMLKEMIQRAISVPRGLQDLASRDEHVLEAVSDEGLFEAARLANPILPQYHPKQLIELLNSGKTRRVKAILLHVIHCLKQSNVLIPNSLSRAASLRRMSVCDPMDSADSPLQQNQDAASRALADTFDDTNPEYDELDGIAPLPLDLLMAADHETTVIDGEKAGNVEVEKLHSLKFYEQYKGLFEAETIDDDLDEMLSDNRSSRRNSLSSEAQFFSDRVPTVFTARHNRLLTEFLTHTHLPGLSSVDQMHLLAVADTLSHFSADAMDKLSQANAGGVAGNNRLIVQILAFQKPQLSVVTDAGSGYATATSGSETVDECGLRFLMAMKQHEYLLLCLPLKQKQLLRQRGLSSSNIIWALHSETKTELLNAIPGLVKSQPTWSELRSLGVAWWLSNNASLALVVEKASANFFCIFSLAHAAFQKRQDPMDASLYYLAMRKKNILTHLFKSVKDGRMADFFGQDFTEEKWRRAAAKNAFVLMSKQRFEHAAAFFLLSGSLKDAVQTVLSKLQDIQLAMVIIRLYETDVDRRWNMMKELLCRQVLGIEAEELDNANNGEIGTENDELMECSKANRYIFRRGINLGIVSKEINVHKYSRAAATLLQEGSRNHIESFSTDCSLSDIFNFYTFLRNHPLVVRQRLTDAGIQMGSTEQFLVVAKKLSAIVTPSERRLYFRTASAHMASGCPMLALDVLLRLPKTVFITASLSSLLSNLAGTENNAAKNQKADAVDWSVPTVVTTDDELKLEWSDDEEDGEDLGVVDVIAQHMKFVASLRLMMEEMSTLASGFEVDGGQLRFQLFKWLEKEVEMLKEVCDYESCDESTGTVAANEDNSSGLVTENSSSVPQHEVINTNGTEVDFRDQNTAQRRNWLLSNQKLLRSFTSYCTLHNAQNYRLTSALMELLLLLLEVQQDADAVQYVTKPFSAVQSFPLLMASISSCKMFVSSPLSFIENLCSDLLLTIAEINDPPRINVDNFLPKVYMLYNLCQGLSSCLYQSLCDVGNMYFLTSSQQQSGLINCFMSCRKARPRYVSFSDDVQVTTLPSKWPGVDNLVALLTRERDEETPQLRLLLTETLFAISMSLFSYAFTAYDSRWLYRLAAHRFDAKQFATVFGGGGGEKKSKNPPPPRPSSPVIKRQSKALNLLDTDVESVNSNLSIDSSSFRAKFHNKVFGSDSPKKVVTTEPQRSSTMQAPVNKNEVIFRWIPPSKNIVQLFAEKVLFDNTFCLVRTVFNLFQPAINSKDDLGVDYNSDDEVEYSDDDNDGNDSIDDSKEDYDSQEHNNPDGFAWILMRIALVHQQIFRLRQFIDLIGLEFVDLPSIAPRIFTIFRLLSEWAQSLEKELNKFPGGCPANLISNTIIENIDDCSEPLAKYNCLLQPNNTPFESDDPAALPVRRLWAYLVRQDHLTHIFVRYLFGAKGQKEVISSVIENQPTTDSVASQPETFKIVSREHEPIAAFACSQVSHAGELQELDITPLLNEYKALRPNSWLNNRTELDIGLSDVKRDLLKDNDDYQLFIPNSKKSATANFMSQFIVDRSRMALRKLLKRSVSNIRRMDAHPSLPYCIDYFSNYIFIEDLSGSSDGSIRLWEWGVGQPLFTPRTAGQYSKITKVVFSANGNKFAAVDGDGLLCLWQLSQGLPMQKHFFSQKCHGKSAADVRFLGSSSSVLVTAGYGPNDQNIALWDTLMPRSKAMIHAWLGHSEGATSVMYLPTQQALISGGRHGELCIWDIRQRQLRTTVKCFENSSVKCLVGENTPDLIVAGSNDGEIKVWTYDDVPELKKTFNDHPPRSGFSLRAGGIQGVQQLYIDSELQLYSCGADCSLKYRILPMIL
uniref:WD_REPEATS_REGION domain-containing protein n=1 Tax=Syphacia muris TaxID=451379 RepID=A0A158R4B7_9BILA